MSGFTESVVEQAALAWLEAIGWQVAHGPDIAPDMPAAERRDYGEVVLAQRLHDAVARLNPALPAEACCREIRTLGALRDTLLPGPISGEPRVKDAEKFIGRAV